MSAEDETTALKEKVATLEEQLRRKEDELAAKEESFTDALEREQTKNRDREQKDAAKREEMSKKLLQLTDERGELRSQVDTYKDIEEDYKKTESQLKTIKKENAQLRVNHAEERQNLVEQRDDRRRTAEKAQQECADLRCQISILEHKYQHVVSKQSLQESQADEMSKAHLSVKALQERLEDAEREQQTEAARFSRDRKSLEDRIARLSADLARERDGPSRVELSDKYQGIIGTKNRLLARSLNYCARTGGPLVPRDVDDAEAVDTFLDEIQRFIVANEAEAEVYPDRPRSTPRVSPSPGRGNNASNVTNFGSTLSGTTHLQNLIREVNSPGGNPALASFDQLNDECLALTERLGETLSKLPEDKQETLLRRFVDSVEANVANSRRFAERSGFPPRNEDPLVLINLIANVSAERDALLVKLRDKLEMTNTNLNMTMSKSPSPDLNKKRSSVGVKRASNISGAGTRSKSPVTGRKAWM